MVKLSYSSDYQAIISADISETLDDFKDILNEIIVKSSDPGEVISQFAKELAKMPILG